MKNGQISIARNELIEMIGLKTAAECELAPHTIFAEGNVSLLYSGARVSLIGSRKASPDGIRTARFLSSELSKRGATIVSGLAAGIDSSAHWEAIAAGASTIAVLGTPLDVVHPIENAELQKIIRRDHLALSQFTTGQPISRKNFPMRNRTMALLSHATIIVEASPNSGTRHQGWAAIRTGRPLFLLRTLLDDPQMTWAKEMIRHGAKPFDADNIAGLCNSVMERAG